MRAIIIIILILGGITYGVVKTREMLLRNKEADTEETQQAEQPPEAETAPTPPATVPVIAPEILDRIEQAERDIEREKERIRDQEQALQEREAERIKDFAVYQFTNRPVPDLAELEETFPGIYIDSPANSVLVPIRDTSDAPRIVATLGLLDAPHLAEQHRVEAIILTASLGHSEEWGLDWLLSIADLSNVRGAPLAIESTPENITVGNDILTVALDRSTRAGAVTILSRPSVLVTPGATATLSSGREVAVPVTNVQDGNAQTSVEFRRVDLALTVTLQIIGGNPALQVEQVNDTVAGVTEIQGNQVPEISSQRWQAQLRPIPGQWYAVGGLLTDEAQDIERRGILGRFGRSKVKERREIGLLLRIIPDTPGRDAQRFHQVADELHQVEPLPKPTRATQSRPRSIINSLHRR